MRAQSVEIAADEHVYATIRRHWYRIALEAAGLIFVFVLLVFVAGAGEAFVSGVVDGLPLGRSMALGLFFVGFVGLLLWMRFFALWSDHWLDAWIITDRRIIDIEQKGFFSRVVSNFPLERIQDVTYDLHGIIATWLHFGDVRIQTASVSTDLIMRQVPFPDLVKEQIMDALARTKQTR